MLEWPSSKASVVLLNIYLYTITTSRAPHYLLGCTSATISGIVLRELSKVTPGDVGSQG